MTSYEINPLFLQATRRIHFILLLIACYSINTSYSQVPNGKEWTRQKKTARQYMLNQISALKVYKEYLQAGYQIADKGLTLIGDIGNGTLNLDKDYFNSLKSVSPVIRKSPKVNQILVYQQMIIKEFKSLITHCNKDNHYTSGDNDYIKAVYKGMLRNGESAIDELTIITTAGETEMKDDERLLRLDKILEDIQSQYAFTRNFTSKAKLLGMQRAKEAHEIESVRRYYQIQSH